MATLFEFIFVLSVAGGFIAWLGDRLGTYIGKKRLSTFGLRPRHTAMLYTILSGVAISVVSVIALLLWDTNVKRALLEGRQLVNNYNHLQTQVKGKQQEIGQWTTRTQAAEANATLAQQNLTNKTAELGLAANNLIRKQNDLQVVGSKLQAADNDLRQTKADLAANGKLLAATDVRLKAKEQMVADLEKQRLKLDTYNIQLANKNVDLQKQNIQLTTEVALSGGKIIFHKNQEIGRKEFATNQSPEQIYQQIQGFITSLSKAALKNGLRIGGSGRAVMLSGIKANVAIFRVEANHIEAPRIVGDAALSDKLDEDLKLKALAGSIAELGREGDMRSVVVVAESNQNTFKGESAKINLLPYPNKLIFPRGTVVATGLVDGSQPDNAVLASLQNFLISQVQPVAKKEGIIPTYDPETNNVSYGQQIDIVRWLDLVKEIHRIGGAVRVTAVASNDTYSEGPLQLDLLAAVADRSQRAMALP